MPTPRAWGHEIAILRLASQREGATTRLCAGGLASAKSAVLFGMRQVQELVRGRASHQAALLKLQVLKNLILHSGMKDLLVDCQVGKSRSSSDHAEAERKAAEEGLFGLAASSGGHAAGCRRREGLRPQPAQKHPCRTGNGGIALKKHKLSPSEICSGSWSNSCRGRTVVVICQERLPNPRLPPARLQ